MFLLIGLIVLISNLQSGQANINMSNDFYFVINKSLTQTALNCSQYIPNTWREWMMLTEPPNDLAGGQMLVLLRSLLSCLHGNLTHMNETAPFALSPYPQILYNIALSEVVSLSFDGILVTKAHIFQLL